ncbi:MAG: hypothetical protein JNL74_16550 [Fibrobacteres bacterium]|nr:hypothetical protein [Fibrobacterota bacterium]
MKTATPILLLLSAILVFGQNLTLLSFPKKSQIVPRKGDGFGVVTASARITSENHDSLFLKVFKNGQFSHQSSLYIKPFSIGTALSIQTQIHAELSQYRIELYVDATKEATADSVLCGDVFLMDGQSNAYYLSFLGQTSSWVRTFNGVKWGAIGGTLFKMIAESTQIPICLINCAEPGTALSFHLGSPLENLIRLADSAGVRDYVRGLVWHQGEDNTHAAIVDYAAQMNTLVALWKMKFPSLERVFMFQIRPGCYADFTAGGPDSVRDGQRRMATLNPLVRVMSTNGLPDHNDHCHYSARGYDVMGQWMAPLILRDLYHSTDTVSINAPDVQMAWYATADHKEIIVRFTTPVIWPSDSAGYSMKDYFYLKSAAHCFDSGWSGADPKEIHLRLKIASNDSVLTYLPDAYYNGTTTFFEGPWIRNPRGIGAFSFKNVRVKQSLPVIPVRMNVHFAQNLENGLSYPLTVTLTYSDSSTALAGSTLICKNLTPSTLAVKTGTTFQAIGVGEGVLQITYQDKIPGISFTETIHRTISQLSGTVVLDSIVTPKQKTVFAGGENKIQAIGYFTRASDHFSIDIAELAVWNSEDSTIAAVSRGIVHGNIDGKSVRITVAYGGQTDTITINVATSPTIIRTNFQMKTAPPRAGWGYNNGQLYTSTNMQGWLKAPAGARDDRKTANILLQSFVYTNSETGYKILVPEGRYILRLGMGDNLWGSSYTWIRLGIDTLNRYIAGANMISTDTIEVVGSEGFTLTVFGAINYLVLLPDNGTSMNSVADDGIPAAGTQSESNNGMNGKTSLNAYPNPFNPVVNFYYTVPKGVRGNFTLYNPCGTVIASWRIKSSNDGSTGVLSWNNRDRKQPSGVYFGRMALSNGQSLIKKVTLVK